MSSCEGGTGDSAFAQARIRNFTYNAEPLGKQLEGDTIVTIVHTNGIHHLPVTLCQCPGREDKVLHDYLDLGLFPASFQSVQSAFTFAVLDDNMLAYLECHTTSYQYYQKLRLDQSCLPRLSTSMFIFELCKCTYVFATARIAMQSYIASNVNGRT